MQLNEVDKAWADFLAERGVSTTDPPQGLVLVALMLDWYATSRVEGVVDLDAQGDMLLFQWGTWDWGSGPTFQIDITRQLVGAPDEGDYCAMWQLSSTLHYPTGSDATSAGSGDRWCDSPADVGAFNEFVQGTVAASFARAHRADRFEIRFEEV